MIIKAALRGTSVAAALFGGWLVSISAYALIPGAAQKVDVLLPPPQFLQHLPDGVSIVDANGRRATLFSTRADLTLALYRAGALLVLPSAGNGCVDYRPAKSPAVSSGA